MKKIDSNSKERQKFKKYLLNKLLNNQGKEREILLLLIENYVTDYEHPPYNNIVGKWVGVSPYSSGWSHV